MTLDQGNLTTGGILPQQVVTAAFGSPAATITPVVFSLATPNPGPDPALIEANVTVDIVDPAQPSRRSRPTSWTSTTTRASLACRPARPDSGTNCRTAT
jgi:hypothetical protein